MEVQVESSRGVQRISVEVRDPVRLTQVLRRHGLPLNTRCGERGLCEGCLVEQADGQTLKACEYHVKPGEEGLFFRIPDRSLTAYEPQVVSDFAVNVPRAHDPLWSTDAPAAPSPPPPPAGLVPLGAAIDIGTTTVVVMLVDLTDGRIVGRAVGFNRQMHLGDDVLTRINLCLTDGTLVGRLQESIVNETVSPLLKEALREAEAEREQLVCLACAGNTTMLHLLAGVDPSPMGMAPFTAPFLDHRVMTLTELDFRWPGEHHPAYPNSDHSPRVHLLPSAGAYLGADLTAGIVATGMHYREGICLLVDVGTNGEIILKHGDTLLGCATAAGPAFEGAGLTDGIRAGRGAISHLQLDADPFAIRTTVIGDETPIGICGSAYIDFLAQGLHVGLLSPSGRFQLDGNEHVNRHLTAPGDCHGQGLRLAKGRGKKAILICESDIAKLLQAKAAIAAGILTLLTRAGLQSSQVDRVLLAGGFGMHLDLDNALTCGLLPGFRREQVELVGNTSLAGAYITLLDRSLLDEVSTVSRKLEVVELNLEPGFEDAYIDQLILGA